METTINPEINASRLEPTATVAIEPSMNTYQRVVATSYSNSVVNFTIYPPSTKTYLNRRIPIHYPVRITFVGTSTDANTPLLVPGCEALRSAVGLRIQQNMNISINGSPIPNTQPYDVLSELVTHYDSSYRDEAPLGAVDTTAYYESSYGAVNNPLGNYANSLNNKEMKRGAYPITVVSNTTTGAVVDVDIIEWLYMPKFLGTNCEMKPGLTNSKQIQISINTNLDPKYLWSHSVAGGSTLTSVSAVFTGQPYMMCKFLTPPASFEPIDAEYEYMFCERYITANNTAMSSATTTYTITSNNIQLSEIPKYLMLYVRPSDAEKTVAYTDTFCKIDGVSILFNNVANLLSTADNQALYSMSSDCGLLDSYQAFSGIVNSSIENAEFANIGSIGSIVMLQFGRHISLSSENLTIGSSGNFNMQVTVQCKNNIVSGASIVTITNPNLYVVPIYERTVKIGVDGTCNVLTKQSKIEFMGYGVGGSSRVPYSSNFGGSNMGGSLGEILMGVHDFIKSGKLVSKGLKAATNFAESRGYGAGTLSVEDLRNRISNL